MRRSTIAKTAGGVVVVLALLYWGFPVLQGSRAIIGPEARRQGHFFYGLKDLDFWLSGTPVSTPITDWSFTDTIIHDRVQTRVWGFIPYSVTTCFCRVEQQLYVFSDYLPPGPGDRDLRNDFPNARLWNRNVMRDPRIRMEIGERIFSFLAYPVPEPSDEYEAARKACYDKNSEVQGTFKDASGNMLPPDRQPRMHFFRLTQVVKPTQTD